jgi:hypothetical protein
VGREAAGDSLAAVVTGGVSTLVLGRELAADSPPEAALTGLAPALVPPLAGGRFTGAASLAFVFPLDAAGFSAGSVFGAPDVVEGRFVVALAVCPLGTFAAGWLCFVCWR